MFPQTRLRRLRRKNIIPLLQEMNLTRFDLIAPLFFAAGIKDSVRIQSMPGQYRQPVDKAEEIAENFSNLGIRALLIFGIPEKKDKEASGAYSKDGVVQQVVRRIKGVCPDMVVITDLCACEYTDHGHCGVVGDCCDGPGLLNDPSLELMQKIAVSQAESGADIVAPSCMLDGMVTSIREALDINGHEEVLIMSYSSKFASALYGPFREAAGSGYSFGDRTGYQASVANVREAYRESLLDAEEGADILMVKPAGWFGDIISDIREIGLPVAAYQVSGEYAMIRAAAEKGWLDERRVVMESLMSIKRAGADLIITYFAEDVCRWLNEEQ